MRSSASLRAKLLAATLMGARVASAALNTDFNILTMNVAGLPAIFNSNDVPGDKATNAGTIGTLFAKYGYDIIHVQEDFNYHAYIYATDNHPYRTATSGGAAIGSGLNTLANFDWINFTRVKWDKCSNASGADCLTPKGFTYMRMLVSSSSTDGTVAQWVDVYNVHADAGTEADDETARNSNLAQVSAYITAWSEGMPVIVFGDTNSRYTRTADNIEIFGANNGMRDAWVELVHGGVAPSVESLCANPSLTTSCETVDKVFYRGSALADLTATDFSYESTKFLQADGNILSDHNPIGVNFTLASSSSLQMSGFWGGPHGDAYTDVTTLSSKLSSSPKVSQLVFRGASRLDSIGLVLSDGTSLTHGGTGGTQVTLALGSKEYWTAATLCQGQKDGHTRIFYVKATTSAGNTLAAGTSTSNCANFAAPAGWQIIGFVGRDGDEMDQIAFLFARR